MIDWYYELITHRNLESTFENFILEVTTNMGFPQGEVCSATRKKYEDKKLVKMDGVLI